MKIEIRTFLFICLLILTTNLYATDLIELKSKLNRIEPSCLNQLPIAKEIYKQDQEDISSLKIIAACSQMGPDVDQYAKQAKEIFEHSQVLSIVPKILEMAEIKDLIPIMKEVEVKKDKSLSDYLMLNELYAKIGDHNKQIFMLEEAIKNNPNDPRPLMLLATERLNMGDQNSALDMFKNYLLHPVTHPGQIYFYAYAVSLVYPIPIFLVLLLLILSLGYWLLFRKKTLNQFIDVSKKSTAVILTLIPIGLIYKFTTTHKPIYVGFLLVLLFIELFIFLLPYILMILAPAIKAFYYLLNSTFLAKKITAMTVGTQLLIFFASLVVSLTIIPTIQTPDLRYLLIFFFSMVLYTTLGTLLVKFVRSRKSLMISLRWIAIAATLPFLISYLVTNWYAIGEPLLFARMPAQSAIDGLIRYLIFWAVSLILSLQLGRIIASTLLEPLGEISAKVSLIEKGIFNSPAQIYSEDEIGKLAQSINLMAKGLDQREKIEKTFSKYIDKKIATRILDGLENEVRIEGQYVDAVIMFADIRGFTTFSEKKPAHEVVQFLNQYFEKLVYIVQKHGGTVDKFIGDNLMSVWGVPYSTEEAEKKATEAAKEIILEIQKWFNEFKDEDFKNIGVGIGINCGSVIAGSLGSSDHMEYTVIGDVVNTAQRTESVAQKNQILVTGNVYSKINTFFKCTKKEPIKLKGKNDTVELWEITN